MKKTWLLLIVMMPFFLMTGVVRAETTGEGQAAFERALQLRAEGRFPEAENAMLEAVQAEPHNPAYYFELSNIYAALYDTWQSRPNAPRAIELLNRSRHALEQVTLFQPDHLAARFNLGVVYKRQGHYELAREEFRKVLELSPDLAAAWYQIGSTYQLQGFYDEAEDAYRKAGELSYDPAGVRDAMQELQQARFSAAQSAERQASLGSFGNYPATAAGYDPLGRSQSLYGSLYGQSNQNSSSTAVLPSLAAMMIQQMLSRNSQDNNSGQ